MKIRFLEPGNRPYKPTPLNYFVYDRYIRTPSVGLNTLATIVKELVDDTYMYSESISRIDMDDVEDADIVFIGIFTFAAVRGYELADHLRAHGRGLVVLGGLHASMNCAEAARHCDYVLLGEGDETIRAFVEAVGRGERPDFPGLAWMEGEELRFKGTWMRISRRAVRDYNFRGTDLLETLLMWYNVRRGEKTYISPYKGRAHVIIDSSLRYEVPVFAHYADALRAAVEQVPPDNERCREYHDLVDAFRYFEPVDPALVAPDSLLREFIGGGRYHY